MDYPANELITAENIETTIKEPYLREIYLNNADAAIEELTKMRSTAVGEKDEMKGNKKKWSFDLEHDIMIAFWLAVDRENIRIANSILDYDINLRKIATLAYRRKPERRLGLKGKDLDKIIAKKNSDEI